VLARELITLTPKQGSTFVPPLLQGKQKGCVTPWPCHLHEKVSEGKRRIMEIKIFHHAKIY
jgi:hypothetical protein